MCSVRGIGVAREREHVHLEAQLAQELLLRDAEALLLVHDHEPELLGDDVAREHAVRSDQDVDLALGEVRRGCASRRRASGSGTPSRQ